jgi:uncharacterized coiled-coil DUF342 family protein
MDMTDHLTKAVQPKHFKIPAGLELKFNIELDDKIYDKLHKDAVWVNDMRKKAIAKGLVSLDRLEAEAKRIDIMYEGLHPSDVKPFILKLQTSLKTEMKTAGDAMAKEINQLIADYKKKKTELRNFNIKCVGKISSSVGSIAVSTGLAAASHGAGLPFVIIGIVKDMAQIAQQCAKLAADVDHYETLVQNELALVGVFIEKHATNVTPTAKAKGKTITAEIGLNAISGVLGIEFGSLGSCEKHIKEHGVKINQLYVQFHAYGKKITQVEKGLDDWNEKARKAHTAWKDSPKLLEDLKKAEQKYNKVRDVYNRLWDATPGMRDKIQKQLDNQKLFTETLEKMKKGVPEWTKYAKDVAGLAAGVGLGMHDLSKLAETLVEVCKEIVKAIMEFGLDKL